MTSRQFLVRAAFWIMVATLGSRLLGFLREVQLAYYFGLSPMRGAFTVAFKIPNLIRLLVADAAISAAFIPILSGYLIKEDKHEASKIASSVLNITFMALFFIVIISEAIMPWIIKITTPGFANDPFLFQKTVELSRIMFPIILILGIGGVIVGVLHSFKHFSAPAIAPIFWNITNLAAVFWLATTWGIYAAAWGILWATLSQLLVQGSPFLFSRRISWKYSFKTAFNHPGIKRILSLMIPVSLAIGVVNFNVLVDNFFASLLGPSEVAAIDSAFRLFHLPQGLFAIAIGTVLFPVLSELIARHESAKFSKTLETGLRHIFYIILPFTALYLVLGGPIVRLCFERGAFGPQDTEMVRYALFFYAFGMAFTSANTLLNRGFYSLKKTWIPLYLSLGTIVLNALLDWMLMKPFGHGGICFSTAFVSFLSFFGLIILLKRQHPSLSYRPLIGTITRSIIMSVPLGAGAFFVWTYLDAMFGSHILAQLSSLSGALVTGAVIYLILSFLFRSQELKEGMTLFRSRT